MTEQKTLNQEKRNKQILDHLMDIYNKITSNNQSKCEFEITKYYERIVFKTTTNDIAYNSDGTTTIGTQVDKTEYTSYKVTNTITSKNITKLNESYISEQLELDGFKPVTNL